MAIKSVTLITEPRKLAPLWNAAYALQNKEMDTEQKWNHVRKVTQAFGVQPPKHLAPAITLCMALVKRSSRQRAIQRHQLKAKMRITYTGPETQGKTWRGRIINITQTLRVRVAFTGENAPPESADVEPWSLRPA